MGLRMLCDMFISSPSKVKNGSALLTIIKAVDSSLPPPTGNYSAFTITVMYLCCQITHRHITQHITIKKTHKHMPHTKAINVWLIHFKASCLQTHFSFWCPEWTVIVCSCYIWLRVLCAVCAVWVIRENANVQHSMQTNVKLLIFTVP